MYRHGLSIVIEDNDLKEPTSSISADVEVTILLVEHADGVSYRMLYVEISDVVLTRVVCDLHVGRLTCLACLASRSSYGRTAPEGAGLGPRR